MRRRKRTMVRRMDYSFDWLTRQMPGASSACGALRLVKRPDHHVLPLRVVHQGVAFRHLERRHRVERNRRSRRLERPRPVVDLRAIEAASMLCVQAVALREEMLEGTWLRVEDRAVRPVRATESLAFVAAAVVENLPVSVPHRDVGPEVRQAVEAARSFHCELTRRVEREEPDPR